MPPILTSQSLPLLAQVLASNDFYKYYVNFFAFQLGVALLWS